jgi:hypothetical protein
MSEPSREAREPLAGAGASPASRTVPGCRSAAFAAELQQKPNSFQDARDTLADTAVSPLRYGFSIWEIAGRLQEQTRNKLKGSAAIRA